MAIGQELSSIDFQSMIGSPLNAVVKAQAQSAQTSVDFIKSVGFNASDAKENPGKPTMVTFEYDKIIETQVSVKFNKKIPQINICRDI